MHPDWWTWDMAVSSALRMLKQEDYYECEASLGCMYSKSLSKNKQKTHFFNVWENILWFEKCLPLLRKNYRHIRLFLAVWEPLLSGSLPLQDAASHLQENLGTPKNFQSSGDSGQGSCYWRSSAQKAHTSVVPMWLAQDKSLLAINHCHLKPDEVIETHTLFFSEVI